MRKVDYVIYIILSLGLYLVVTPIQILGLLYFIIFHELGHALVATYKDIFMRFGFHNGNPGVLISELDNVTLLSGMVLNLLTMNIVFPLIKDIGDTPLFYIGMCIVISLLDLHAIFRSSRMQKHVPLVAKCNKYKGFYIKLKPI